MTIAMRVKEEEELKKSIHRSHNKKNNFSFIQVLIPAIFRPDEFRVKKYAGPLPIEKLSKTRREQLLH
jgi:hypothetical protein